MARCGSLALLALALAVAAAAAQPLAPASHPGGVVAAAAGADAAAADALQPWRQLCGPDPDGPDELWTRWAAVLAREPGDAILRQALVIFRHGERVGRARCWAGDAAGAECEEAETLVAPAPLNGVKPPLIAKRFLRDRGLLPNSNCQSFQLTARGVRQLQRLGAALRAAYVGPEQLLGARLQARHVYARSDNTQRTVRSVESVLSGMWTAAEAAADAQPLSLFTTDVDTDPINMGAAQCPALAALRRAFEAALEERERAAAFVSESARAGPSVSFASAADRQRASAPSEDLLSLAQAARALSHLLRGNYSLGRVFDCVHTHVCLGRPLPAALTEEWLARLLEQAQRREAAFHALPNRTAHARLAVGGFAAELRELVEALVHVKASGGAAPRLPGGGRPPRLALFGVHDTTLIALLAALDAWDGAWPPFAAALVLEVLEVHNPAGGFHDQFAVRALWQGRPLRLRGCPDELCPVSRLVALLEELAPRPGECDADEEEVAGAAPAARSIDRELARAIAGVSS
jgi:hypothetical protein